ncbi:unnamed protein product [Clonostachys rhizophaga]|uniref:NACHT domain-containing protein n=1 Tax=Clonostachys rhizophaga TaxID=160324 RepID=A0A9N9YJL0_9HYPO|nr:unnamed protein product [Clonostachys rhizophaga]
MEGIGVAANLIAVVDLTAKTAAQCYDYGKKAYRAKADIDRVQKEIIALAGIAKNVQGLLSGLNGDTLATSNQLQTAIGDALDQLRKVDEKMALKKGQKTMSRLGLRALKWPLEKSEIEGIVGDLRNCGQNINSALQVDQTVEILKTRSGVRRTQQMVNELDQNIVLTQLPVAEGACFGSHTEDHELTCLPNTRVDLLRQIQDWVKDLDGPRVFWLNGMAGTGKSTISRTVAQHLDDNKMLGASFFFKTGEAERSTLSKFFSTIAADMVIKIPEFGTALKQALDKDADFRKRAPGQQLKNLVIEPLMRSQKHRTDHPIVLIVDALDECERYQDIDLLINLFTDSSLMTVPHLKIFITSRPEIPNRRAFGKATAGSYHPVILHELLEPVIEHDISVFLDYRLDMIRTDWNCLITSDYRRLPSDWPGQDRRRQLVQMAVPLFIFAMTMCRFIADIKFGSPEDQIQDVLAYGETGAKSRLDSTYLPILSKLLLGMDGDDKRKVIQKFKSIVGPIVMLETPLSTESLSRLLQVPKAYIDDHLVMLHSVLSIPTSSDLLVRMLHLSFRDFLTDRKNKEATDFWIDEKATHADIASRALALLDVELRQNMCNLPSWATERSSIKAGTINAFLPPEVQYSCSYWVRHLHHAGDMLVDGGLVHKFFETHFLHWLECLGLLGDTYGCISHIKTLQMLVDPRDGKELSLMLDDAVSFVLANALVIDTTPLQLYSSLLIFAPMKSYLRTVYKKFVSSSHDSKLVVSTVSIDYSVRIWDVDTGQCIWILEGHKCEAVITVFSDDSTRVLSASDDRSIRVWSVSTGECISIFEDYTKGAIHGFGFFTPTFFASRLRLGPDELLKAATTETGREFELKSDKVYWVAFSPNAKFAVSEDYGSGQVRLWNLEAGGKARLMIDPHFPNFKWYNGAFSQDSAFLAYPIPNDGKIRIFQTNSGDQIDHLAFSYDSSLVASSSRDGTVRIWRIDTSHGHRISNQTESRSTVTFARFSPDVALIATSDLSSSRIWDAMTGECKKILTPRLRAVSKDWSLILAGPSKDSPESLQVMRLDTGALVQTFHGIHSPHHGDFSPDSRLVIIHMLNKSKRDEKEIEFITGVWLVETGQCLKVLEAESGFMEANFSTNGRFVATSTDHGVSLWNTSDWCCTRNWRDEEQLSPSGMAFSPDSTFLASSRGGMLKVWHCDSGKCLLESNHGEDSRGWSFSSDSKFVAISLSLRHQYMNQIQLWRVETGQQLYTCNIESGPPVNLGISIRFTPNDSGLETGRGVIAFSNFPPSPLNNASVSSRFAGYGLSSDGAWITWDGHRLIRIPSQYRPWRSAVHLDKVVLGSESGRVSILRFASPPPATVHVSKTLSSK